MKIKYERQENGTPRFELSSGCGEYPGCTLTIATKRHHWTIPLPQIIKPYREWVDTSMHSWASAAGGYWEVHPCRYGFYLFEGEHLYVSLGAQTHDSRTTKKWSCFLPWTQWRYVRFSLYDANGDHFWTQLQGVGKPDFDAQHEAEQRCPKRKFQFLDYDDELIEATTLIQEREWERGEKWCSWLSLFYRPMVRRDLDIAFSKETGSRKGSWKGGTLGHGIQTLPNELHEAAFRRYCAEHGMTFLHEVAPSPERDSTKGE